MPRSAIDLHLIALGAVALLAVASCSGRDDDGGTATNSSTVNGIPVVGSTTVALDGEDREYQLTSCVTGEDRITFQGTDGEGRTVIGTFSVSARTGSFTVSDADGVWAAGAAASRPFDELDVAATEVTGAADFLVQTFGPVDQATGARAVVDTGATVPGTFAATCTTTTTAPP